MALIVAGAVLLFNVQAPAFFTVIALARVLGLSLDDDLSLDALPGGIRSRVS